MKMESEKTKTKKQLLNLIYFFDGGKTHTVRLSYRSVKACLVILALLVAWATLGSALFIKNIIKTKQTSARLQLALDKLFEYESKYDSIFERVYSVEKIPALEASKPEAHEKEQPSPTATQPVQKVQAAAPTQTVNLLNARQLYIRAAREDGIVSVESPSIVKNEKQLNISIALRNKKGQSRAEGLLWATAEWQDAEGKTHVTKSPENIKGKQYTHQPQANTFSIRLYTVKTFFFPIPENATVLSKVEIWLADRNSNRTSFEIVTDQSH